MNIRKFEVGKTYSCRSFCDHNCIYAFEVTKRTEKSVWLKDRYGKVTRRQIDIYSGRAECCSPHGKYSMSALLTAEDGE